MLLDFYIEHNFILLDVVQFPVFQVHLLAYVSLNVWVESEQVFVVADLEVARVFDSPSAVGVILKEAFGLLHVVSHIQLVCSLAHWHRRIWVLKFVHLAKVVHSSHRHLDWVFINAY